MCRHSKINNSDKHKMMKNLNQLFGLKTIVSLVFISLLASCSSAPLLTGVGSQTLPLKVNVPTFHLKELKITRMVHASVLIEYNGQKLLTDPWFTETNNYPPGEKLASSAQDVSNVNLIISTMDHYDHFDLEGIKNTKLANVPILVPFGTKQRDKAIQVGLSDIRTVESSKTTILGEFKVTAIPARKNTKPESFDYETAWLVEAGDWKVLIVGHRIEPDLLDSIGSVDIAILPINKLRIKPMFKQLSLSPNEAALVAKKVKATIAIPYHYMYKSSWLWESFIVSHKGTAQEFAEAFRNTGGTPVQLNAGGILLLNGNNK